jgi:hypothetical protein
MSRKIVENYFMHVGRSYYRSPEFDAERARLKKKDIDLEATSQFGIGILSCFMVADRFEVETYRTGHTPLHITIEGPTKYFTIKLLNSPPVTPFPLKPASDLKDGPPLHPGTRVTVHLRPDTKLSVFQVLERFAVNIEYELHVHTVRAVKPVKILPRRWESKRIRLSDFPSATGDYEYYPFDTRWGMSEEVTPRPSASKSLQKVLTPSFVEFQEYDFSRHLRGRAWLWLLKGEDGEPCPRRGYLRMADDIELAGLPKFIGDFAYLFPKHGEFGDDVFDALRASRQKPLDNKSIGYRVLIEGIADYNNVTEEQAESDMEYFIRKWNVLSPEEREAACDSLEAQRWNSPKWFESSKVPEELLTKSFRWSTRQLNFEKRHVLTSLPQAVALHGIFMPGGFIKWDPMNGYARKLRLLPVPGGLQMDLRSHLAPSPAANRLFVDMKEAENTAVLFARAVLRHVLQLAGKSWRDTDWQTWVDSFIDSIGSLYFWPKAIRGEMELLERSFQYSMLDDAERVYMSREQLVEKYGRWVPLRSKNRPGLNISDERTLLLLSQKSKRKRKDTWEVDMESSVSIEVDTLKTLKRNWLNEMGE